MRIRKSRTPAAPSSRSKRPARLSASANPSPRLPRPAQPPSHSARESETSPGRLRAPPAKPPEPAASAQKQQKQELTTQIRMCVSGPSCFTAARCYQRCAMICPAEVTRLSRPPRVGSPVGCFDHGGMECAKGLTCKNSSVFNGWRVLQAFGREEFLIEMLIELSLVDGQHSAGSFLYRPHLDMARAPDAGNFLERRGVKFADQFSVVIVHFGMQDDRNTLHYPVVNMPILRPARIHRLRFYFVSFVPVDNLVVTQKPVVEIVKHTFLNVFVGKVSACKLLGTFTRRDAAGALGGGDVEPLSVSVTFVIIRKQRNPANLRGMREAHKRLAVARRAQAEQHELLCGFVAVSVEDVEYGSHRGVTAGVLPVNTVENFARVDVAEGRSSHEER